MDFDLLEEKGKQYCSWVNRGFPTKNIDEERNQNGNEYGYVWFRGEGGNDMSIFVC